MNWNELKPNIKTLEAEIVNKVYENIDFLVNALALKGFDVEDYNKEIASYSTQIVRIAYVLLGVEDGLSKLDDIVSSVKYGTAWELENEFTVEDYNRWILILNDLYDIIMNGKGQWRAVKLVDCIPTINGKKIAIRGEQLGERT